MSNDHTNPAAAADDSGPAVDWASVNDGIAPGSDDDFEVDANAALAAAGANEEGAGVVPAAATPAPATPAPAAPAAAAPPVAAAPPPAAPPAPPVQTGPQTTPAPTPEQLAAARAEFTAKLTSNLEENFRTQLTDEDARELVVNPEKVLPKLMAKASLTGMEMAMHFLQQQLPQFVKQQTAEQLTGVELEKQFYTENSDLNGHNAIVNKMVSVAKATLEPTATQAEILAEAAALARRKLKLPDPAAAPAAGGPAPAPAKPRAFAPARAAGTAPTAPAAGAKGGDNIWAQLAEDED